MGNKKTYTGLIKFQAGLSIIEILIALVIGLILIAGLAKIYLANKQSSRLQESVSYVNNNARYATYFLQDVVSLAGFKGDPAESNADAFPTATSAAGCSSFSKGQYIAATNGGTGTGLFCVRMKAPVYSAGTSDVAVMRDCLGNTIADKVIVTTRFFISANNELSCSVVHSDGTTGSQPLVSDLNINPAADLQFGIDTNNDQVVDKVTTTPTGTEWKNILALDVTLNLTSNADTTGSHVTTSGSLLQRTVNRTIAFRSVSNPKY